MLTTNFRALSQKSLTILLTLGLLGGAAAAQLGARPSVAHAMMARPRLRLPATWSISIRPAKPI